MIQAGRIGLGLIVSALALNFSSNAKAQLAPPPSGSTVNQPPSALMMNPFYNPYMNPLVNPAAPQQRLSTSNTLLYMYTANTARGGIGSGRLSNPGTPAKGKKKPSNMPNSASTPGGGAARYFNPGSVNTNGAGRYYNQYGGHFMNNGN